MEKIKSNAINLVAILKILWTNGLMGSKMQSKNGA